MAETTEVKGSKRKTRRTEGEEQDDPAALAVEEFCEALETLAGLDEGATLIEFEKRSGVFAALTAQLKPLIPLDKQGKGSKKGGGGKK